jgi:hypothetical protein
MVYLAHSVKGLVMILLYDAESLTEELALKLVGLHLDSDLPLKRSGNTVIFQDLCEIKSDAVKPCPEIVSLRDHIKFFDPLSRSAALLLPSTDAVKDVLPSDPLNVTHRDLAFGNNYTSHEGACPYFSSKAPSGCLLDPNVVRTTRVQGRSFIEGHPCVTSTDHSLYEEKSEKTKEEDNSADGGSKHSEKDKERQQGSQPEPMVRARERSTPLLTSTQISRES